MNIFGIILAFFGLPQVSFDQLKIAYDRIIRFILLLVLPTLLFCYFLNIGVSRWDWWPWLSYISYLIGLILSLVFLAIALSPEVLAIAGITSLATARKLSATDPARKRWDGYKNLVWIAIAWINIPFMFIGGIPFGGNPVAILAILSTVIIISALSQGSRWKKAVTFVAIIILLVNSLSLVTRSAYYWMTGTTLWSGPSKTDRALSELEAAEQKRADDALAGMISSLASKKARGVELTKKEQELLDLAKEKRDSNSLPTKISEKLSQLEMPSFGSPATASTAAPEPVQVAATQYVPTQAAQVTPPPSVASLAGRWEFNRSGQLDVFIFKQHPDGSFFGFREGGNVTMKFDPPSGNNWTGTHMFVLKNIHLTGTFRFTLDGDSLKDGIWSCEETKTSEPLIGRRL